MTGTEARAIGLWTGIALVSLGIASLYGWALGAIVLGAALALTSLNVEVWRTHIGKARDPPPPRHRAGNPRDKPLPKRTHFGAIAAPPTQLPPARSGLLDATLILPG